MEVVQKEHSRLLKRTEGSQGIKNVESAIDSLQSARDAIAAGQYLVNVDPLRSELTAPIPRSIFGLYRSSHPSELGEIIL